MDLVPYANKIITSSLAYLGSQDSLWQCQFPVLGRKKKSLISETKDEDLLPAIIWRHYRHNQILTRELNVSLVVHLSPHKRGKTLVKILTPLHNALSPQGSFPLLIFGEYSGKVVLK